MDEQVYLGNPAVADFVSFLCDLAAAPHPCWRARVGVGRERREVPSLAGAVAAYRWRGSTLAATNVKREAIRGEMFEALQQCDTAEGRAERRLAELELLFVSTKTLSWGRVYEGAFGFLIHQAETGVLSRNLRAAAALIDGTVEDVATFDDNPHRSDCGMSKVYAAINRRTVVYDDRLGAALAWLCRGWLEAAGHSSVPDPLAFMAGERDDPRRNPSADGFVFPDKRPGREHARWNLRANWILDRVASEPSVAAVLDGQRRERLSWLEAALFVIGDDVLDQPATRRSSRAPARPAVSAGAGAASSDASVDPPVAGDQGRS